VLFEMPAPDDGQERTVAVLLLDGTSCGKVLAAPQFQQPPAGGTRIRVLHGAAYVVDALARERTTHLFMVPGGLNDPFMEPMTSTEGVTAIVAAFEGGAAYMADGWGRATGRVGAAFGIGGPGVLNMTTALAGARSDRACVLAISGEVPVSWEGRGGFQDATGPELNDTAILAGVCDRSVRVESAAMLDHQLRTLLLHSLARHAPVHLSIPRDPQRTEIAGRWEPLPATAYRSAAMDDNALDRFLGLFDPASGEPPANVVALAGPGVRFADASEDLAAFAERWEVPVATTLGAKGVMPEDNPLALGSFGYGGSRWATGGDPRSVGGGPARTWVRPQPARHAAVEPRDAAQPRARPRRCRPDAHRAAVADGGGAGRRLRSRAPSTHGRRR
jgi:thiamine pyrophosphate-dependent acetolactate synthase large subunit-like protein